MNLVKRLKNKRVTPLTLNTAGGLSVHIPQRGEDGKSRPVSEGELESLEVKKAIKNKWVVVVEEEAPKEKKTAPPKADHESASAETSDTKRAGRTKDSDK